MRAQMRAAFNGHHADFHAFVQSLKLEALYLGGVLPTCVSTDAVRCRNEGFDGFSVHIANFLRG